MSMYPKKVRFLGIDSHTNTLTYGETYDVIAFINGLYSSKYDRYLIKNDHNIESEYYISRIFQDVTAEYRNDLIDEILR